MFRYPIPQVETHPEGETIEQADGSSVTQLPGGSIIIRERAGSRTDHLQLRYLHMQMDQTHFAAYGWHQTSAAGPALALRHGLYEADYLPEKDRARHTIHPAARKEILKRPLQPNHQIYAEEESKGLLKKKAGKKTAKGTDVVGHKQIRINI